MADTPQQRAADIRLLVLDVDGVLTDGRLYFSPRGEELKVFHVRDGAGIVQVLRAGIAVAVISGRDSRAVERRMTELGVSWVRQGVSDKLASLRELLDIPSDVYIAAFIPAVACIGDDTPDVPLLANARLGVAVADAHAAVREQAHYVTRLPGGQGAVREVCDLILASRGAAHS